MANRWFVGNATAWSSTASWSSISATGASGATVPTASDDVFLTSSSPGNLTIDVNASCRSITVTGFTHAVTHSASVTVSIGSSTAPPSNVSLIFPTSGWTYTIGSATTSVIKFVDTSAATNTADFGGQTIPALTITNGSTTTTKLATNGFLMGATSVFTLSTGKFDSNNINFTIGSFTSSGTPSLTLGTSIITALGTVVVWTMGSSVTLSAASSTINVTGAAQSWFGGTKTYGTVTFSGSGAPLINDASTYTTLTRTGTVIGTDGIKFAADQTITTFNANGNSVTNRLLVQSSVIGTPRTLTVTTNSFSNADFSDITAAGGANWDIHGITGNSGDCGGNTGITFTTQATQWWVAGTGSWSDSTNHWASSAGGTAGTGRTPLPQDTARFDSHSFTATLQTATLDMPRTGSVDWTSVTNNPQWTATSAYSVFGSVTLVAVGSMRISLGGACQLSGRGSFTYASAAQNPTGSITVHCVSGTYTLSGDLNISPSAFTVNSGTWNANNNNMTANTYSFSAAAGCTVTVHAGTGTWNINSTTSQTVWNVVAAGGDSYDFSLCTVKKNVAGSGTMTFAGGGQTYGTLTYTLSASTGSMTITGSNRFTTINFSDASNARTLNFTAGTTNYVEHLNVRGTSGKLMTIASLTASSNATINSTGSRVNTDFLQVTDMVAQGPTAYAGANSTLTRTTNWIAAAATGFWGQLIAANS